MSVVAPRVWGMVNLGSGAGVAAPRPEVVRAWRSQLADAHQGLNDEERIDMIRYLEELKCAAEAAQAVITADFDASQRNQAAKAGEPADCQGRGIAAQIALARRESPHRGQQQHGLSKVLHTELPCTLAAFRAGKIPEHKATIIVREAMGNRELAEEVRKRA